MRRGTRRASAKREARSEDPREEQTDRRPDDDTPLRAAALARVAREVGDAFASRSPAAAAASFDDTIQLLTPPLTEMVWATHNQLVYLPPQPSRAAIQVSGSTAPAWRCDRSSEL